MPRSKPKQIILKANLFSWMASKHLNYASVTSNGKRLTLDVKIGGEFQVRSGDAVLYIGYSATDACKTYNDAQ